MKSILSFGLAVLSLSALADGIKESMEVDFKVNHEVVIERTLTPENCPNLRVVGVFKDLKSTLSEDDLNYKYKGIENDNTLIMTCDYSDPDLEAHMNAYREQGFTTLESSQLNRVLAGQSPRVFDTHLLLKSLYRKVLRPEVTLSAFIPDDENSEANLKEIEGDFRQVFANGELKLEVTLVKLESKYLRGLTSPEEKQIVLEALKSVGDVSKARNKKSRANK